MGPMVNAKKEKCGRVSSEVKVASIPEGKNKWRRMLFRGAIWGLLIGLLFAAPWLGLAIGAAAGAGIAGLSDFGIDDKFIKKVGSTIEPGRSALFLLVHRANLVKFQDELKPFNPTVLQTSLSDEDEAKLQEAFGADEIVDTRRVMPLIAH